MRTTRIAMAAAAAVVLSLALASATLASGPATSHRGTVTATCGDQTYIVAVENGGKNIGAAQIVDAFGHAILVHGTSTFTDTTVDVVLGQFESFHGVGHANQAQTLCVSIQTATVGDLMTAADLAQLQLDPAFKDVALTDTLAYQIDFWVVLKV